MNSIDLNCDLGEGLPNDEKIIPYISSANIACGFHAGNDSIIRKTIELCLQHNVAIGAHPGYADKQNFGRVEKNLLVEEYYDLVAEQLYIFQKHTDSAGIKIHHVKPHGALYNQAAKEKIIARAIVKAVKDVDENMILYGLSGSHLISEAQALQLKAANEVFADRTYQDDASLTPRSHPTALITEESIAIKQVLKMIKEGSVSSVNEIEVLIQADTICIHGDGNNAFNFAKSIHQNLKANNIEISTV